jgi:hypothetical protein
MQWFGGQHVSTHPQALNKEQPTKHELGYSYSYEYKAQLVATSTLIAATPSIQRQLRSYSQSTNQKGKEMPMLAAPSTAAATHSNWLVMPGQMIWLVGCTLGPRVTRAAIMMLALHRAATPCQLVAATPL